MALQSSLRYRTLNVSLMKSAKTLALDAGSSHFCRDADGLADLLSSQTSSLYLDVKRGISEMSTVHRSASCRCLVLPLLL